MYIPNDSEDYLIKRHALTRDLSALDRDMVDHLKKRLDAGEKVELSRTSVRNLLQPVFRRDETPLESIAHFVRTGVDYVLQCTTPRDFERSASEPFVRYTVKKFPIQSVEVPACTVHPELNGGTTIWIKNHHPLEGDPAKEYARSKQRWRPSNWGLDTSLTFGLDHTLVHKQGHCFSEYDDVARLFFRQDVETIRGTYATRNVNVPFPVLVRLPSIMSEERRKVLNELHYEERPFFFSTDDRLTAPVYPPHAHMRSFEDNNFEYCPF